MKPNTPAACSPSSSPTLPGHRAAPEPDVDVRLRGRGLALALPGPPTVVVAGMLLSGMSITVVTPPAAAERVPVSKPSHSVRPGSLMCTCVSTRPGSSTSPSARRDGLAGGDRFAPGASDRRDPPVAHGDGGRPLDTVDDRARGDEGSVEAGQSSAQPIASRCADPPQQRGGLVERLLRRGGLVEQRVDGVEPGGTQLRRVEQAATRRPR